MDSLTFVADTIVYLPIILLSLGLLIGIGYIFYYYKQHNAVPPTVLTIINGIIYILKLLIVKPIKMLLQFIWWLFPIFPDTRASADFGYVRLGAWEDVNRSRSLSLLFLSIFIAVTSLVYQYGYPATIQDYSVAINSFLIFMGFILLILCFLSFNRDIHGNPTDPWPPAGSSNVENKRANWLFRNSGTYLFYTIAIALIMAILCIFLYFVGKNGIFSVTGTTVLMVLAGIGVMFILYQMISSTTFFAQNIANNPGLLKLFYAFFIIPCLFFDTVRYLFIQFRGTPKVVYLIFAIEILLVSLYIIVPMITNYFYTAIAPEKDFKSERIKRKLNSLQKSNEQIEKSIENIKKMKLENNDKDIIKNWQGSLFDEASKLKPISKSGWDKIISDALNDPNNEDELRKFLIDYGYKTKDMCDTNPYISNKSDCKEKMDTMVKYIQTITTELVLLINQHEDNKENIEKLKKELKEANKQESASVLLVEPVYLKNKKIISDFSKLKMDDFQIEYNYNYTISGWFFIRAQPPNFGDAYAKYTPILDYGGKPTILYNGKYNKLKITMNNGKNKKPITHVIDDFPLQTWTNIVVTYNGGTLDIFINSKLVASIPNVVPYMNHDPLSVGSDNGIGGGVCNVVYFPNVISLERIKINYKALKNSNPPVIYPSNI